MEDHPETKTKDKPAPRDRPKRRERALEFAPSGAFFIRVFPYLSSYSPKSLFYEKRNFIMKVCK